MRRCAFRSHGRPRSPRVSTAPRCKPPQPCWRSFARGWSKPDDEGPAMILTSLALTGAAACAGAAAYVSLAEQPARLQFDDVSLLREWKPSYASGLEMQATLALVSGLLGLAGFFWAHHPAPARIVKWGKLHAVRTFLGLAGACAFVLASTAT